MNYQTIEAVKILIQYYPDKKEGLLKLLPEHDPKWNKPICRCGDALRRKGNSHRYIVVLDRYNNQLMLINQSLGYTFKGRVTSHSRQIRANNITLAILKSLLSNSIDPEEFFLDAIHNDNQLLPSDELE